MKFDETPRFWYPCVALDVWTNFVFCSDENLRSDFHKSYREANKQFLPLSLLSLFLLKNPFPFDFHSFYFLFIFFLFVIFLFIIYLFFLVLSFPLFPPLDTWLNMSHSHKCTTCYVMCHRTSDASKNVKFRLSRNSTKFDVVTRFRQTNSTMKSISSSEI